MAEWNRDTPWRQGHLLGRDAIAALALDHTTEHEHLDYRFALWSLRKVAIMACNDN